MKKLNKVLMIIWLLFSPAVISGLVYIVFPNFTLRFCITHPVILLIARYCGLVWLLGELVNCSISLIKDVKERKK